MVIVFLIAIFTTVGIFRLGAGQSSVIESEAKQFVDKLNLLMDESVLTGQIYKVRIDVDGTGYSYEVFSQNKWSNVDDKPYQEYDLPRNLSLMINLLENTQGEGQQDNFIAIQNDGVTTKFELLIGHKNSATDRVDIELPHWIIYGGASVSVEQRVGS